MTHTEPVSSDKSIVDRASLAKSKHQFVSLIPQWVHQWIPHGCLCVHLDTDSRIE